MSGDRWCIDASRLVDSASRRRGLSAEKETAYLQQISNFLQDLGRKLNLPLLCINTAVLYTQRFYVFHPMTIFEKYSVSASALFLAAKVEEHPRKVEHVCQLVRIMGLLGSDISDADYAKVLLDNENFLLQTMGFDVKVQHPHQHVLRLSLVLQFNKTLSQAAYLLATYCLHLTQFCLMYKPVKVACLCIYLASKTKGYLIPLSREGKQWWLYADPTITEQVLEKLAEDFYGIFNRCPVKFKRKTLLANHENLIKQVQVDASGLPIVKDEVAREIMASDADAASSQSQTQPTTHEVQKKSLPKPCPTHSSERVNLTVKPTCSRSVLNPERIVQPPGALSQSLIKASTSSKDYAKNKIDLNQSKSSRHAPSPALKTPDMTNPAFHPGNKKAETIRSAIGFVESSRNRFEPRKSFSLNELDHPQRAVMPQREIMPVATALPTALSASAPVPLIPHTPGDMRAARTLTSTSTSSGSLKISIPRSRITGIQPLVPPHRPATKAEVPTDQSKIYRIPTSASLGSESSRSAPKRFKPN